MNHPLLLHTIPSVVDVASLAWFENDNNSEETVLLPVASANIVAVKNGEQIPHDMAKSATSAISMHLAPCTTYVVATALRASAGAHAS